MGIAAIIGMAVGIFGVGLVFVTFRETRKAAAAARDTHNAFISVERARFVFRKPFVNFDSLGQGLRMTLRVDNIGKSGAVATAVRWMSAKKPRFPSEGFKQTNLRYRVLTGECEEVTEIFPAVDWHTEPYVVGYVEYESAFSKGHRTYFCYKLEEAKPTDAYGPATYEGNSYHPKTMPTDT